MRLKRAVAVLLVAALVGVGVVMARGSLARRATAAPAARTVKAGESWYGAYLAGRKIGYMSEAVRPVERDGQSRLEYVSRNYAALDVLGQRMEQVTAWVTLCDLDFAPLDMQFTLQSGGRDSAVTAKFLPDRIECTKTSGANTTQQTVPIPAGVKLLVDGQALLSQRQLKEGESLTIHQFNPITLDIDACKLTALRREPLAVPGRTLDVLVVKMESPMVQAEAWVDGDGQLHKLTSSMMQASLEFRREDKDTATSGIDSQGPRVDLVVATSIRPDRPIDNAAQCRRLALKVKGLERLKGVPTDDGQKLSPLDDGRQRLTVTGRSLPESSQLKLPLAARPELAPFLAPSPYVESDHPEMKAKAAEVVGDERDPAVAAGKLHDFVHQHIRWQSNIGLFRSGLEILRDPAGVCRDAAALYTALARAAGLPTRVCAGLVYVNGAFMGHAWAETWCGQWLPVDATRPGRFVDATHLKLAQGAKYTAVFEMLPALGALSIEVEEAIAETPR